MGSFWLSTSVLNTSIIGMPVRIMRLDHALGGSDGGTADGDHIFGQRGAVVARHARAVEHAPEQVVGKRDHHGPPEEAHRRRSC